MGIYGLGSWEPMSVETNVEFEKFICKIFDENYVNKWDFLAEKHGYAQGVDIAIPIKSFIERKSIQRKPFSIIRANDGEGSVTFEQNEYPDLEKFVVERISKIMYADKNKIPVDIDLYRGMLKDAILTADIIGAPERSFINRRLVIEEKNNVDVRAICGVYNQISSLYDLTKNGDISTNVVITTAWLSKYLLSHYSSILNLFPNVVIITGNKGLATKIKSSIYEGDITEINIPTQRSGENEKSHWPERYNQVIEEIESIEGYSLVLVAAGVLGKSYCSHAKKHGHGALDIGHVADIWDGKISRPGVDDEMINKWKLS